METIESRAMVLQEPGQIRPQVFKVPFSSDEEICIAVESVAICGSDPTIYSGGIRETPFPIILGHEIVGSIEAIGYLAAMKQGLSAGDRVVVEPYRRCGDCRSCRLGNYVFCGEGCYGVSLSSAVAPHLTGGYAERMILTPGAQVHHIDSSVPSSAAALSSVVGNAHRWIVTRSQVAVGETVGVIGVGAQALMSVLLARRAGADGVAVFGLSSDAERLALAESFGATEVHTDVSQDGASFSGEFDVVVETSGTPSGRQFALHCVRSGGRVVLVGVAGIMRDQSIPNADAIVRKEVTVLGGLGQAGNVGAAVRLLENDADHFTDNVAQLVQKEMRLENAEDALRMMASRETAPIRVLLRP
jgi:alcohol dehydrogenase